MDLPRPGELHETLPPSAPASPLSSTSSLSSCGCCSCCQRNARERLRRQLPPVSPPSTPSSQQSPGGRHCCRCRECRGNRGRRRRQPATRPAADVVPMPGKFNEAFLDTLWQLLGGRTRPKVANTCWFFHRYYEDHRHQGFGACDMSPLTYVSDGEPAERESPDFEWPWGPWRERTPRGSEVATGDEDGDGDDEVRWLARP
jgi:hypothetical protein